MKRTGQLWINLGSLLIAILTVWGCSEIQQYPAETATPKIRMGYYASWKKTEFDHTKVQYKYLTHLAHAFTKPDSEGNLIIDDGYIYPELNTAAHENNVKIIMSVGGWGRCEGFPGMVSTPENRRRFIDQVLEFCRENAYDGADIDWEYISNPEEQQNFVYFIKELSNALKVENPPLLLTMAVPSGHYWGRWISYEEVAEDFDFIGCMTYDYHGEWTDHSGHNSPLFTCNNDPCGSMSDSYQYLTSSQVPVNKLLLGIPFYGRSFDCSGLYQKFETSSDYGYTEVMNFLNSGWTYLRDDCSKVPYLQNPEKTQIISFDDNWSVSLKCEYIKEKNVAGVIIWEISQDYDQDKSVLLEIIAREFEKKAPNE